MGASLLRRFAISFSIILITQSSCTVAGRSGSPLAQADQLKTEYQSLVGGQQFRAGITHIAGKYRFTDGNFLIEGIQRIAALGAKTLFVYMQQDYAAAYPDNKDSLWPAVKVESLTQLAQTAPYQKLFAMDFKSYVITAYSFSEGDAVINHPDAPGVLQNEENEFYELTKYLILKYQKSGKVFVLKHWEGDWIGLLNYDASVDLLPARADAMVKWFSARQRGINRARAELSNIRGVAVMGAVEVNRVMDYLRDGKKRVIDQVVPRVGADMITYSSYDSSIGGEAFDPSSTERVLTEALSTIDRLAPDPLHLGKKRILISEFGLYENDNTADPTMPAWRTEAILKTAKSFGIFGAYFWELFDNECYDSNGQVLTVNALGLDDPRRPTNSRCHGLWVIRPDGTSGPALPTLQKYF